MGEEEPEEIPVEQEPEPQQTPEQIEAAEKEKKKKFEREKKLALQVLAQDIKLLKEFSLTMQIENLMERFARLSPDDPQKTEIMEMMGSLTKERLALRRG